MRLTGDWKPRDYQLPAWQYLEHGGKHAELVWHRRAGKDDIALRHAAVEMHKREATYWHMLPLANQVRKAIWESINPHTGKRRIYEAFPRELFDHRETDMLIKAKYKNSTWQCLGSDNYEGAIGSPPAGITFSEWALANPSARGYLRPILKENNGYQVYITTPRGKNHAYKTYNAARKNPKSFAQILTIEDTGILSPDELAEELQEYISTYGEDQGIALFQQEYMCSFDAAILGAFYGSEFSTIDREGRILTVEHDPDWPVHTAWDIGRTDDTAIWWFQVIGGEVRILEFYSNSFKDPDHFASHLLGKRVQIDIIDKQVKVSIGEDIKGLEHRQEYRYGSLNLPHDAFAETFAAQGKSVQEQLAKVFGWDKIVRVPGLSEQDGIQAARKLLSKCIFDESCEEGIECLRQYQREWDDDKKKFKDKALHDWTSHAADAFRYLAIAWQEERLPKEKEPAKWPTDRTFNQLVESVSKRRTAHLD